jgi:NADP-dependent 3-hydroxy acid dehydrogenase YdfG
MLIAGNPDYGLSAALSAKFPEAVFASRSNGWDLSQKEAQTRLAKESLAHDVFLSVSCLFDFHQTVLVQEVAKVWHEAKHPGYMIVLGSSADTPVKGSLWLYPAEKKALRAYCRQISQGIASTQPPAFKMTYLSPGNMHTPKQDEKMPDTLKLDCDYVAGIIAWLTTQPVDVNISEFCLDRIQR